MEVIDSSIIAFNTEVLFKCEIKRKKVSKSQCSIYIYIYFLISERNLLSANDFKWS